MVLLVVAVVVLVGALVVVRREPAEAPVPLEDVLRAASQERAAAERAAMNSAVQQLVRMNQEMMDAERRLGSQELEGKKTLIDQQVGNMRAELAKLTGLLHDVEAERREHTGELTSQLREAGRHTQVLAETTQSLREALSSTTARGQWGERMAEDVLRLAGFIDGVNYRKRQAIAGSGGIPDYTFLLPQGLCLHMDVKFPLNNYMRYLDAGSDVERERLRKEFLKDVRLRLKEVTSRDYVDAGTNTVDCVLALHPQRAGLRVHPGAGPVDPRRRAEQEGDLLLSAHPVRGARSDPAGGRQLPPEPDLAGDPGDAPGRSRSSGTGSSSRWTRSAAA